MRFMGDKAPTQQAADASADGDIARHDVALTAPEMVDHWMVGCGAAVAPVDSVASQQVEVLFLEEDAGRKPRETFVECGLEAERARRSEEGCQHRDWLAIEAQGQAFDTSGLCCAQQALAKELRARRIARER